jgi:hypothetical protein
MNKKEIVAEFLKRKILVTPEMLNQITEENYKEFLEKFGKKETHVVKKQNEFKVEIKEMKPNKKISVKDVVDSYNEKYKILRDILLKKTEAVSLNKAKSLSSKVSLIGIVTDITQNGFIVEDTTGSVEVFTKSAKEISLDDIVALTGYFKQERFFLDEIIWPDVPLSHTTNEIENLRLVFSAKPCKDSEHDFMITTENVVENKEKTIVVSQNPGWVKISKGKEETLVLVCRSDEVVTQDKAIQLLKKRSLPHTNKNLAERFLINPIPNIVWFFSGKNKENWAKNYKGVVLISSNSECCAKFDSKTKETTFEHND